jgi:hypothetical protein
MTCTISKLQRRERMALTQAERKFDTAGGKSPYSEDPRNSCVGTYGLAAPFVRLRHRNQTLPSGILSQPNDGGKNGAPKVGYAN